MPELVAIVTDSTSDIDPDQARVLSVTVVPLFINFGDRRQLDRVELSRAEFYRKLETEPVLPTTSQPTAQAFTDAFEPYAAAGRPIVCITISQKLSGTINAARAGAQALPGANVELVDSATTCSGLMLQVVRAAELARGGAGVETIKAALLADRATQHGYATLPDLKYVARTGRLGKAQAVFGSLLKIVPVLAFREGEVAEESRVRTFSRAQDSMIEAVVRDVGNDSSARIAVAHANAPQLGQAVAEKLAAKLRRSPSEFMLVEAGPAIAVHAGPGAVGIFCVAG